MPRSVLHDHAARGLLAAAVLSLLAGCTTLGSMMSPYPEKFGCKNSDHGVCIHPEKAYEDAVAGRPSRSDPAVTNDKKLLKAHVGSAAIDARAAATHGKAAPAQLTSFAGYRASVYAKLQGLIEQPVTPMLRQPRTVRTLILPYADRERPDRLYMPRYVFSILDRPEWTVGDYLVEPVSAADQAPILGQVKDRPLDAPVQAPRP